MTQLMNRLNMIMCLVGYMSVRAESDVDGKLVAASTLELTEHVDNATVQPLPSSCCRGDLHEPNMHMIFGFGPFICNQL